SPSKRTQVISAVFLGLGLPGFLMILYPPWQVILSHLVVILLVGLAIRDKIHITARSTFTHRLLCIVGALLLAGALSFSWISTCLHDLKVMAATVYPGQRASSGGDYFFGMLFKGMYNLSTIYETPGSLKNQSEAASFYYLFPAVLAGVCLSKRIAR